MVKSYVKYTPKLCRQLPTRVEAVITARLHQHHIELYGLGMGCHLNSYVSQSRWANTFGIIVYLYVHISPIALLPAELTWCSETELPLLRFLKVTLAFSPLGCIWSCLWEPGHFMVIFKRERFFSFIKVGALVGAALHSELGAFVAPEKPHLLQATSCECTP